MLSVVITCGCIVVSTGLLVCVSSLLRENRELRDKLANAKLYNDANKATAQSILDDLKAKRGEVLELTDDLRICGIERDQNEALYLRARKRTGVWL